MKKLITILALSALTLATTFASISVTEDNRDIKINGAVKTAPYEFALSYNGSAISDGSTLEDSYDLSTTSKTKDFIVQRTAGNLNDDLDVDVSITAGAFIGEFNGEDKYNTGLIPEVKIVSKDYSYEKSKEDKSKNSGSISLVIPAGSNLDTANLAAFYLNIKGDSSIPAGNFISTVSVAYTYEQ